MYRCVSSVSVCMLIYTGTQVYIYWSVNVYLFMLFVLVCTEVPWCRIVYVGVCCGVFVSASLCVVSVTLCVAMLVCPIA